MFAVLAHAAFDGIRTSAPLQRPKGGVHEPYEKMKFEKAMKSTFQTYECAGNLAWINEMYKCLHGVPLNMAATKELANHNCASPHSTPATFVVAADSLDFNPTEHKGQGCRGQ